MKLFGKIIMMIKNQQIPDYKQHSMICIKGENICFSEVFCKYKHLV